MLTRALMLNPFPMLAPAARTAGMYLTRDGKMLDVTWDAAAARLNVRWIAKPAGVANGFTTYHGEIQTAVGTSGRVAARMSDGRVGLYDVTATGLAATPAAAFPASAVLNPVGVNGNGDVCTLSSSSPPVYTVRNLYSGQSVQTVGQSGYAATDRTHNTGDGWLTEVEPVTGERPGERPWAAGTTGLTIRYDLQSPGVACLASIASPGGAVARALPLAGIPKILARSNRVFVVRPAILRTLPALPQTGAGTVAIPVRVNTEEVDVEQSGGVYLVSYAKAYWDGYILATADGAKFVPLSVHYVAQTDGPCTLSIENGVETYTLQAGYSFTPTALSGQSNLDVGGILRTAVVLSRPNGRTPPEGTQPVPAYRRTVDPRTGSFIADPVVVNRAALYAIPHLGAIVGAGSQTGSTNQTDLATVAISFDGGRSFTNGVRYTSQSPNSSPVLGSGSIDITAAIPLFLV